MTGRKTKPNRLRSGTWELVERALTKALGKGVSQPPWAGCPSALLSRTLTLASAGSWHCRSSEEDDCHTQPVESTARLYAEWSSHPASSPAVSATGCRAAAVPTGAQGLQQGSDASPEPNIQLKISESFKGEQKPLCIVTG